jgi:hypothetical protein
MSLVQNSADVRFRDVDLSQSLRSASSSIGALVLVSSKGRPGRFQVTNPAEFIAEYGYPNASISMGHYCALDALLEMSQLVIVRALNTDAVWSAGVVTDNGSGITEGDSVLSGVLDPTLIPWDTITEDPSIPIFTLTPKSGPGSWANTLAFRISSDNLHTPGAPIGTPGPGTGTLAAGSYIYKMTAESAAGETLASQNTTVVLGATGQCVLTWPAIERAIAYNIYGRSGTVHLLARLGGGTLKFTDDGSLTPGIQVPPTAPPAVVNTFDLLTYDTLISTSVPQLKQQISLQDQVDGTGQQLELTQKVNAFNPYFNAESNVPSLLSIPTIYSTPALTYLTGGSSGTVPTTGQIALAWQKYFYDPEPVQVNVLINGGVTAVNVQQMMDQVAQHRRDSTAILDVPSTSQDAQTAIDYRNLTLNMNSAFSALYSPDLFESDNYSGKLLYVPPSGAIAAVYARTDRIAGPQFAPAGLNRGQLTVLGLRPQLNGQPYNDSQRTQLFNAQVNYSRKFIGMGTAVFEQTTLQSKASAMSWVAVRRMVNVIEISIRNFLMWNVHEPNDDFLRRTIVLSVSDYLQSWKDARGVLAYEVISDTSNNPPNVYNLGILKVSIFITPIIAAHEIQVDTIITKAGVSFAELNIVSLG